MRGDKKKKILKIIFILSMLLTLIYIFIGVYKEDKIKLKEEITPEIQITRTNSNIKNEEKEKVDIVQEYLGYEVNAELVIPSINLDTYVLKEFSDEAMKVSVVKFWGPGPNEIGNFCIAGHNYKNSNMFYNLIDLKEGDEIYLLDNKNGKYTYIINEIYRVKPENISPLNQNTDGKRVITLISCVNYSDNRIIIHATEQ